MMNEGNKNALLINLDQLHTTDLGVERIRRNLSLEMEDVVNWCRVCIEDPKASIMRRGKNWYISNKGCEITVNAYSYTIITAHKLKNRM